MSNQNLEAAQIPSSESEQEELVAQWLIATPGFFNRHPQLLTQIELASSHDGRALSLQEKQMDVLRSQNRDLNRRMFEMLQFGVENDRTQSLMVKWLEELCAKRRKESVIENITLGLNQMFQVGRVEYIPPVHLNALLNEQLSLGVMVGSWPAEMDFPILDVPHLDGSFALVPLIHNDTSYGAILMISSDVSKYTLDVGLVYLQQLGTLAAAALSRFEAD